MSPAKNNTHPNGVPYYNLGRITGYEERKKPIRFLKEGLHHIPARIAGEKHTKMRQGFSFTMKPDKKEKILIVEDIEESARLLERLLAEDGYETAVAYNGKEALTAINKERPGLILLDIEMPEMNGLQACQAVRNDTANDAVPIVMLTVKDQPSNIVKALEEGADDYLFKSATKGELLKKIKNLLTMAAAGNLPSQYFLRKTGRRKSRE